MPHIYRDHIDTDMNYETFVNICQKCWEDKHGFLLLSKDNGRYRKRFDQLIMILGVITILSWLNTYNTTVYQEISICQDPLHYIQAFFHFLLSILICIIRFQILMKK